MTAPIVHWNPNLHPKYPKGAPGGLGGQFMPVGGTNWSTHVNAQTAPAGHTAAPPPVGGWAGAVAVAAGASAAGATSSGHNVINGFYFPAGRRVPLTGLTGVALQSALIHNAVQPVGTRLATAKMMTTAQQTQKTANSAHGTARQAARAAYSAGLAPAPPVAAVVPGLPAAPAAPAAGRAPTIISHTHTLVGTFYFPTGQQVPTGVLSGAKLAAAQKHNAANPGAPMSYGYQPIPQKVLASQRFNRPPQGLTQVQGYLFPTGAQVPLKGLVGTRKMAAIAHNAAVLSGSPAPAHPQMNLNPHVITTPSVTVASSTHVPVLGSDLRASLDYKALQATVSGTGVSRSSRGTQYGSVGDAALWDIYTAQGFHGAPEVVPRAEFDTRLVNGEGWIELFRGNHDYQAYSGQGQSKTKKQIRQEFATGTHHYAGYGMYGNGTYAGDIQTVVGSYTTRDTQYTGPGAQPTSWGTAPPPAAAFQGSQKNGTPDLSHPYWDMTTGGWTGLIRIGLRPDARVIDHRALLTLRTRLQANAPANMQSVFGDEGRFAAALGYDAIRVKQTVGNGGIPYHVILNRSAIMVERPK